MSITDNGLWKYITTAVASATLALGGTWVTLGREVATSQAILTSRLDYTERLLSEVVAARREDNRDNTVAIQGNTEAIIRLQSAIDSLKTRFKPEQTKK